MTNENTKLRIYGAPLGVDELFVDAEVTTITLDEDVTIADVNNNRDWTLSLSKIRGLRGRNLLIRHANCEAPNHKLWSEIRDTHSEAQSASFDTDRVTEQTKAQFQSLIDTTHTE